ncbi:MAG: thioredoxin-disulfide reductase [Gemmatimonadales bacterium]|nr:thioredoxin-disulfide reductase [Gemmatimonadales bacterium]MDZ4389881.1 thioredoxin-disulfide reductase [Gemmatimonadales bacterium]
MTATPDRNPENVVIIGSGPAAWTAAIYAARANLHPLVYEGEPSPEMIPGGQLMWTTDIDNFPGFPEGIGGQEIMGRMRDQAIRFGTRVVSEAIASVDFAERPFTLKPTYTDPITAHAVIVATGARAIWLGLPNETRLAQSGGGVSACAVCDGALPFYRDKVLAVVGGGDSAMEEAVYLTKFAREVVIIHRRDAFRAAPIMIDLAMANPKIRVEWNTEVADVLGDDFITGLTLKDTATGEQRTMEVGGLFLAIGHAPNTGFLGGQLETNAAGYVTTPSAFRTITSVEGVFAAGDVIDDYYRQAITSAGTGCMAALDAERWLTHNGLV